MGKRAELGPRACLSESQSSLKLKLALTGSEKVGFIGLAMPPAVSSFGLLSCGRYGTGFNVKSWKCCSWPSMAMGGDDPLWTASVRSSTELARSWDGLLGEIQLRAVGQPCE